MIRLLALASTLAQLTVLLVSPSANAQTPPPGLGGAAIAWETFSDGGAQWTMVASSGALQQNANWFLRFTPPAGGSAEAFRAIIGTPLSGVATIQLRINVNGSTLLGGDASALYLDQNGWHYVSLDQYVQQGSTQWQTVSVPVGRFAGFNPAATFARLGLRFWQPGAGTSVDVDDIQFVPAALAPTTTPTSTATPTQTSTPTSTPTVTAVPPLATSTRLGGLNLNAYCTEQGWGSRSSHPPQTRTRGIASAAR